MSDLRHSLFIMAAEDHRNNMSQAEEAAQQSGRRTAAIVESVLLLPKMYHRLFFPDSTATSVNLIQKCLDPAAAAAFVEFHDHVATLVALNYSKKGSTNLLSTVFYLTTEALRRGHGEIMILYFAPFEVQIHIGMLMHKNYPQF